MCRFCPLTNPSCNLQHWSSLPTRPPWQPPLGRLWPQNAIRCLCQWAILHEPYVYLFGVCRHNSTKDGQFGICLLAIVYESPYKPVVKGSGHGCHWRLLELLIPDGVDYTHRHWLQYFAQNDCKQLDEFCLVIWWWITNLLTPMTRLSCSRRWDWHEELLHKEFCYNSRWKFQLHNYLSQWQMACFIYSSSTWGEGSKCSNAPSLETF